MTKTILQKIMHTFDHYFFGKWLQNGSSGITIYTTRNAHQKMQLLIFSHFCLSSLVPL